MLPVVLQPTGYRWVCGGFVMITTRTDRDIGTASTITIDDIREHYDMLSPLYRTFWGEHIHHGYWHGEEPAAEAQENLIKELAHRARIV